MDVPENVKKMIDENWCMSCSGRLQECIEFGGCTKVFNKLEEENDVKNVIQFLSGPEA